MSHHEETARNKKARLMADILSANGISEDSARSMTAQQWRMVAQAAGCHPPRSESTRQAVYAAMQPAHAPTRMTVREWRDQVEAQCQS